MNRPGPLIAVKLAQAKHDRLLPLGGQPDRRRDDDVEEQPGQAEDRRPTTGLLWPIAAADREAQEEQHDEHETRDVIDHWYCLYAFNIGAGRTTSGASGGAGHPSRVLIDPFAERESVIGSIECGRAAQNGVGARVAVFLSDSRVGDLLVGIAGWNGLDRAELPAAGRAPRCRSRPAGA